MTNLLGNEGQQSDLTGTLNGLGQLTLMHSAGTGGTAGQDLGALADEAAQLGGVLVIDVLALVHAELADLAALAAVAAAIVCPVVNTGVFLLGCRIFFLPMLADMAQNLGFGDNVGRFMIIGLVGVNFLAELGINIVLSPVILRLIRIGRKEN